MAVIRQLSKEQYNAMLEVVRGEVNLAQELLDSYQDDLNKLESDTNISKEEKVSREVFLKTAIKESNDLLNLRKRQLSSIAPTKSGRNVNVAKTEVWNDLTLESKGMEKIMRDRARAEREAKHAQKVSQVQAERQARSDAMRDAANALVNAANKLAEEKNKKENENSPRPDYLEGASDWILATRSNENEIFIYRDPKNENIKYIYIPQIEEVIKSEQFRSQQFGNKKSNTTFLYTFYNYKTNTWNQVPNEVLKNKQIHFNVDENKWMQYNFKTGEWKDFELNLNKNWHIPVYDENGNPLRDKNGALIFRQVADEEVANGGKTDKEKADFAKKIQESIIDQEKGSKDVHMPNEKLNWIQRFKLWFMRLFNKSYQLPAPETINEKILNDSKNSINEPSTNGNEQEKNKESKRIIRGFKTENVKKFFKDNKRKIIALSAFAVATLGMALGINGLKQRNKNIIEQRAIEAQRQEELERQYEERLALAQVEKEQRQQEALKKINTDKLINHDASILTTGSVQKQYVAPAGLEYSEDSMGRGAKGTVSKDMIVEIFNRAIIKENDDGTKQILLSSGGKTWEDYAKDTGRSIEDIQNLLKKDKTYEAAAIQVGGTNHHIFNTLGWVKMSSLSESSRGTENLENFEITTGDNTEILQQLQQQEKSGQDGAER